jgi:predicted transposase YbfD/YdcC
LEERSLWVVDTDPQTLGLPSVCQVVRIERHRQELRRGVVTKDTTESHYAVTSLRSHEADPNRLLAIARDHWSIENGQHHRRDRTQDEDRCQVRHHAAARNLCLFRSLAIFLCKREPRRKGAKLSLPDFQRRAIQRPAEIIARFESG